MADETYNRANREQLVIAIRYVNTKDEAVIKKEQLVILDLIADKKGSDKLDATEHN